MKSDSETGFTIIELMIATATLLVVLSVALTFFAHGQRVYTNEHATLDMVQDLRTTFDRLTNEIRMAGAGLPGFQGVVSGTATQLIVRGDFSELTTFVRQNSGGGVLTVGTTSGFSVGQTLSMLNVDGRAPLTGYLAGVSTPRGAAALTKITAVNPTAGTITVGDLLPISAGATLDSFGPGSIINVVERRTYNVITSGPNIGAVTRSAAYENAATPGAVIRAQEIIARNVIATDVNGKDVAGLRFSYLDAADQVLPIDPDTGLVDPNLVVKVAIDLEARTAQRDLVSNAFRTLRLSALIQVRGQYVPAVGF